MPDPPSSVQRSFRLSRTTSDLLDGEAEASGESRNALADRLIGEAIRIERHPLVRFRTGGAGRREPALVGTRLLVRHVVATVRAHDNDLEASADYFDVATRLIRSAVSYYAEFSDEVDDDSVWAERIENDERARWEREQAALG